MPSPGYPCYRNILSALGCEVVEIPCGPETRFQPTVEMLAAITPPVTGLILASPANPTGTVIPPEDLAAIATWCETSGVQLVSDELYHGLVYPGAPATSCAWETSRDAIVVNSFSKYFAMTGWRLGWLLVPPHLHRAVDRLTGNFSICPPTLPQLAGVAAFTPESIAEADALVDDYAVNRELLLRGLPEIGLPRLAPADGAFYVYADISDYSTDSLDFCARLLADTGVAIAPGVDFDTVHGGVLRPAVVRRSHGRGLRGAALGWGRGSPVSGRASRRPSCTTRPVTMPAFGDASQPTSDADLLGFDQPLDRALRQQHLLEHLVLGDAVRAGLIGDLLGHQRGSHVAGVDAVARHAVRRHPRARSPSTAPRARAWR